MKDVVMVTKSSPVLVVGPPASHGGVVDLTSTFDGCVVHSSVTSVLLFDRPIHEPADTVKRALSEALAHYGPVAGRLAYAGGEHLRIEGATGVPFVAASANCALADITTALLGDLAERYPGALCRHADPLLLVQVTEFACGGFAVAATWNHVLTDGAGMAQFLQAVGEFACGASPAPSVVPLRSDDGLLPRLPPSMDAAQKLATSLVPSKDLALLDVTIPWGLIDRVRAEFAAAGHGSKEQSCTVFEAVVAVLWQCRTRATVVSVGSDDSSPTTLSFAGNVRKLVGARRGYYGNCVVVQSVHATRGAVANGATADVARLIRRAKDEMPDLLLNGGIEQVSTASTYDMLTVSSWRNLGFETVEFGGGRAARVVWHKEETVLPGCVVCPSGKSNGKDGISVMALCVRPEHADAFLAELAISAST